MPPRPSATRKSWRSTAPCTGKGSVTKLRRTWQRLQGPAPFEVALDGGDRVQLGPTELEAICTRLWALDKPGSVLAAVELREGLRAASPGRRRIELGEVESRAFREASQDVHL
jgi:hypothetical protein